MFTASGDSPVLRLSRGAVFTLLALLALSPSVLAESKARVVLDSGPILGEVQDDLRIYRGIPFAQAPVGSLRWQPPKPVEPWSEDRSAENFGNACPQLPVLASMTGQAPPPMDEDCLFLNVWTEAQSKDEKRPVMVWIHGGGLALGWSNQREYEGTAFAQKGVVLVSTNYRLGALGYLAHPELSKESANGVSGNYGFLDQVAALEWVQRNIEQFGGDPDNVTIFGESAGGTSVHALLTSPLADGLFHRAIAQSPWVTDTNITGLKEGHFASPSAEELGTKWAEVAAGEGATLAKLREIPAQKLIQSGGMAGFSPVVTADGWFMPSSGEDRFAEGLQSDVPTIVGTNTDEGTMFLAMGLPANDRKSWVDSLATTYGEHAAKIDSLYGEDLELRELLNQYMTHSMFLRGARRMLLGSEKVSSPSYQYQFTRVNPLNPAWGAHHAAELSYVFNTLQGDAYGDIDHRLAQQLMDYWVNFAKTGDPNGEGLPSWPVFDAASQNYLELGDSVKVGSKLDAEACDELEAIRSALDAQSPATGSTGGSGQ